MTRTLAHVSDLHIGRDPETNAAAANVAGALLDAGVDEVLLTGDVTHRGRRGELDLFERAFAPLAGRLVVVPGNHDRAGEDAAQALIMPGSRVRGGDPPRSKRLQRRGIRRHLITKANGGARCGAGREKSSWYGWMECSMSPPRGGWNDSSNKPNRALPSGWT